MDPHMQFISPGFFQTLNIPVMLGRDFTDRDDKGTPPVALINERFAKRYFAGRSPVGLHVGMGGNPGTKTDIEIVGVVKDTRYESLRDEVPYELYRPYRQMDFVQGMTVYARAQGDPTDHLRQHAPDRQRARFQRPHLPHAHAGAAARQVADERAPAGLALVRLRTPGHHAGGHRPLRRDGLHGGAAHARDRHPHGAGRQPRFRGLAGDARSAGAVRQSAWSIGGAGAYAATRLVQRRSSSASCPPTRSPWRSPPSASPRSPSSRATFPRAAPRPSTRCTRFVGSSAVLQ